MALVFTPRLILVSYVLWINPRNFFRFDMTSINLGHCFLASVSFTSFFYLLLFHSDTFLFSRHVCHRPKEKLQIFRLIFYFCNGFSEDEFFSLSMARISQLRKTLSRSRYDHSRAQIWDLRWQQNCGHLEKAEMENSNICTAPVARCASAVRFVRTSSSDSRAKH